MKITLKTLLALSGAALGSSAVAQPFVVNISGATLQQNFFTTPASTIDFLDVNNSGTIRDQLAPFDVTVPFLSSQYWQVQYRATGSVFGLTELDAFGTLFATSVGEIPITNADNGWNNRTQFISAGMGTGPFVSSNPFGAPVRSLTNGTYSATTSQAAGTGIQMDIAPLDVPVSWAVQAGDVNDAQPLANPTASGYGKNPRIAVGADGTELTTANSLAELMITNTNTGSPDAFTIYDTPISWATVAYMTNLGTGLRETTITDLQHLFATGRRINGENLMAITRDSGSGTRNAANNGILLDPSWGVGENIGDRITVSSGDLLGANFQPSNKGGSSRMEATVFNHRLAVGYSGAERGINNGWLPARAEILAIQDDVRTVGGDFVRPTTSALLNNSDPATAYRVIGPAVFATIGDPRNENSFGGEAGNTNPAMRNPAAAAYMNNITRSIEAFKSVPGGDPTLFTPAEFLAQEFILPTALDSVPVLTDPQTFIANTNLNQALQNYTAANSVYNNSAYASFSNSSNGRVPTRTTGVVYTDGVANGGSYRTQAGATLAYGTALNTRNKIAGDFDGNGARDLSDAPAMIAAWNDRNGGAAWAPGSDACIEILGDFNGDGNFDAADVRYFADGLAIDTGRSIDNVNRFAGFEAVDAVFGGNFFGTTLATGVSYTNGASAGDVSGDGALTTRGFAPIGFDGVVDAYDIDYVCANFGDWSDLAQAVRMDLSADMNGDLVVDAEDVRVIVEDFLGTQIGDVNLDGVVDGSDESIAMSNLGMEGGWAMGDVNCDGMVTQADIDIITGGGECPGDTNGDNIVNFTDLNTVLAQFGQSGAALAGDVDGNGVVNFADLNMILSNFGAECN